MVDVPKSNPLSLVGCDVSTATTEIAPNSSTERAGVLSRPFTELPLDLRERAVRVLLELPVAIGLVSLCDLAPLIGHLRRDHQLNILGMEALAAAKHLDADVHLSASSPLLEGALRREALEVRIHRVK